MITQNDVILLLTDLESQGVKGATEMLVKTIEDDRVSLDALKFINDNKPLVILNFYEYLRKQYNDKKSKLYINIVKEIEEPSKVLVTLSSLLTQIFLYNNKIENKSERLLFLNHSRAKDISNVLSNYCSSYDINKSIKLLKLIKADLKALESIK